MTKPVNGLCVVFVSVISLHTSVTAQDTRAFNQNASRSNHTTRGLVISLNSSKPTSHNDSVARNGSFMPSATVQYYYGDWGLGVEAGGFNSSPHFNIDEYIKNINGFTDLNVSSTEWKNLFIVAGPSFRKYLGAGAYFGVDFYAGLMKIKSPSFSITDKETGNLIADFNYARKTTTANENPLFAVKPGIKLEWFPGNGPLGLHIHGSYMNAFGAKEITNYYRDLTKVNFNGLSQQEIRAQVINAPVIETKSKGAVSNISFGAGISIALNHEVKSPRDAASGLATGKRSAPRDAASGLATGKRSRPRDAASGLATGRRSREAGSGLATGRRQYRDAASGQATGKRSTRQTQGLTFGEKVNAGANVIIGTITANATGGIITNKTVNPLYEDKGTHGENPMAKSASITLVDEATGEAVATTTPEDNGEFFFANVPSGDYILKLSSVQNNPLYKGSTWLTIDIVNDPEISSNPAEARRRVEVLKSNKTGDPNANKVEHWGDPHENVNGKHIKTWITAATASIYISLD